MKPDFPYANEEGTSICQLNSKGYALLHFVEGMFEEDAAFASFRSAGGTAEDWMRFLAELTEPETIRPSPAIMDEEAMRARLENEALLQRIFPVAELVEPDKAA